MFGEKDLLTLILSAAYSIQMLETDFYCRQSCGKVASICLFTRLHFILGYIEEGNGTVYLATGNWGQVVGTIVMATGRVHWGRGVRREEGAASASVLWGAEGLIFWNFGIFTFVVMICMTEACWIFPLRMKYVYARHHVNQALSLNKLWFK